MSTKNKALYLFLAFSLFLMACGGTATTFNAPIEIDGGQIGMEPGLPYVVGNDGQAHPLPIFISDCIQNNPDQAWDGEAHVTFCTGQAPDEGVDVIDAAMIATAVTPWPGDETVVGIVWASREAGKLVLKVLVAAGTYIVANEAGALLRRGYHTDPSHDPYIPGSRAREIIAEISAFWVANGGPGNDPNRFRCLTLKVGQETVRYFYWLSTDGVAGKFAVLNAKNSEWITAFDNRPQAKLWDKPTTFNNVKGTKIDGGCNNFTPPGPPALATQ